jgi:hypothetical protein
VPEYSVMLTERNCPTLEWGKTTLRVRAVSAKHAMKKAEKKLNEKPKGRSGIFDAKSARRITVDHDYWRKIWRKAYDNMPSRVNVQRRETWQLQEPNTTPLPVFIRQSLKGNMRQDDTGIYKKLIVAKAYRQGQHSALTSLLKYARTGQRRGAHFPNNTVYQSIVNGRRPKEEWRRELLLQLAGPDGTRIAAGKLGEQFRPLKIKGGK